MADNQQGGDFERQRPFPFEHTVRQRYRVFRTRRQHGFSSLLDLVALIVVLGLGIVVLTFVFFVMLLILFIAPFIILGGMILRWLGPKQAQHYHPDQARDADVTIIDVDVDRH